MLRPVPIKLNRGGSNADPSRVTMPPAPVTSPMIRNGGTISAIMEEVKQTLEESVMGRLPGTLMLEVRVVETGDIRDYEVGFRKRTKTQ